MLKPEQVPDEVWHTTMSTYHKAIRKRPGTAWQEAIAAAINAWPGMKHDGPSGNGVSQEPLQPSRLILPLPTSLQKMQTTQSGDAGDEG